MKLKIFFIAIVIIIISFVGFNKFNNYEINKKISYSLNKLEELSPYEKKINYSSIEYKYLLALQLNRWDVAKKILKPLVDKGDEKALFWYAYISPNNSLSGDDVARKFSEAAEKGNPYAAMQLSNQGEYCNTYLINYCSEKWKKRAIDILISKNKKNTATLLDQYYLKIYQKGDIGNLDKNVVDIIYRNAEAGNYGPLLNYIVYVFKDFSLSEEQYLKLKKILQVPIESNYIPAMQIGYMARSELKIDDKYIIDKYSSIGGYCSLCSSYYEEQGTKAGIFKLGVSLFIKEALKKSNNIFKTYSISDIEGIGVVRLLNIDLKSSGFDVFSDKDILEMKNIAIRKLNREKIPVFINEANYGKYIYL